MLAKYLNLVVLFLSFYCINSQSCKGMQRILNKEILPKAIKKLSNLTFKNAKFDLLLVSLDIYESKIIEQENTGFTIVDSNPCELKIRASAKGIIKFKVEGYENELNYTIKNSEMKLKFDQDYKVKNTTIIWGTNIKANINDLLLDSTIAPFFGVILEGYCGDIEKIVNEKLNKALQKQEKWDKTYRPFLAHNIKETLDITTYTFTLNFWIKTVKSLAKFFTL